MELWICKPRIRMVCIFTGCCCCCWDRLMEFGFMYFLDRCWRWCNIQYIHLSRIGWPIMKMFLLISARCSPVIPRTCKIILSLRTLGFGLQTANSSSHPLPILHQNINPASMHGNNQEYRPCLVPTFAWCIYAQIASYEP